MTWDVFQSVWPLLVALAYLFITFMLFVLASQRNRAIAIHQRLSESKALRHKYLAAMRSKKEQQEQNQQHGR